MKKKTNTPETKGQKFKWPHTDMIRQRGLPRIIEKLGMRWSLAREDVLNVFYKYRIPLNIEMISQRLVHKDHSLSTIYRAIESFEKIKVINRIDLRANSVYYELNDIHHHHIVCTKCGLIEEMNNCEIEKIIPASTKFEIISEHSLEFFGICKKCARL